MTRLEEETDTMIKEEIKEEPKEAPEKTAKKKTMQEEWLFLPLGGAGEIGMNLNLYGYGPPGNHQWIIVDMGVIFSDKSSPGVDRMMPDASFIEKRKDNLLGLVLTHGHEDHIGAVAMLWPRLRCPIYATPFTAELVRGKLAEAGFKLPQVPIHEIALGGGLSLKPFEIEFITLTHSIPEPNALAIRTPLGCVLHTGDWKIDPAPVIGEPVNSDRLTEIGAEGVLAMVCDSTNVFEEGTAGSEADVRVALTEVIKGCKGRVIVTCFASNVARLKSIAEIGKECGRRVALAGRSMRRMTSAAAACGFLDDLPPFLDEAEASNLPRDKTLIICTGSQGEDNAALARLARRDHQNLSLDHGDTVVFSSRVIPGNEREITKLYSDLVHRGISVITEADAVAHPIHVSGHPCRDDLKSMYEWIRPRCSIPVHGEWRHLTEHARLARSWQVPAVTVGNGDLVRLAPGDGEVVDQIPHGRLRQDGDILLPRDEDAPARRIKLANSGAVFITLVLDENGALDDDPDIRLLGMPAIGRHGDNLEDVVHETIEQTLTNSKYRKNPESHVRREVRRALFLNWGKRPDIEICIVQG